MRREYEEDPVWLPRWSWNTKAIILIQVLLQRCRDANCNVYAVFRDYTKAFVRYEHLSQRKWTWRNPDYKTKNEIDFVISKKENICVDILFLNTFDTDRDHRLVRRGIHVNSGQKRYMLICQHPIPTSKELYSRRDK